MLRTAAVVALVVLVAPVAWAEPRDAVAEATTDATTDGAALPLGIAATRDGRDALITASSGYDAARGGARFEAAAEVHLAGPIWLRGGASYASAAAAVRPSAGVVVDLARLRRGLPVALAVSYRPEGLTEPEGEVESTVAIARRGAAATLLGNLTYGQDPEGKERDGELRLALFGPATARLVLGVDARVRVALARPRGSAEPVFDLVAGPLATVGFGRLALTAQAGVAVVELVRTQVGPIALVGVARAL